MFLKRSSLQRGVTKLTSKYFHEIDPASPGTRFEGATTFRKTTLVVTTISIIIRMQYKAYHEGIYSERSNQADCDWVTF